MLKGMAMPLLFFPSSFLSTLSTLLIPEISEAHTLNKTAKVERMVNHTLHITLTLSILISGIFLLFSRKSACWSIRAKKSASSCWFSLR